MFTTPQKLFRFVMLSRVCVYKIYKYSMSIDNVHLLDLFGLCNINIKIYTITDGDDGWFSPGTPPRYY